MSKPAGKTPATGKEKQGAAQSVEEAIRRRAYQLYLERGGAPGRDVDDWLEAEREFPAQHQSPATRAKRKT